MHSSSTKESDLILSNGTLLSAKIIHNDRKYVCGMCWRVNERRSSGNMGLQMPASSNQLISPTLTGFSERPMRPHQLFRMFSWHLQ